jgi:hypothetical protein
VSELPSAVSKLLHYADLLLMSDVFCLGLSTWHVCLRCACASLNIPPMCVLLSAPQPTMSIAGFVSCGLHAAMQQRSVHHELVARPACKQCTPPCQLSMLACLLAPAILDALSCHGPLQTCTAAVQDTSSTWSAGARAVQQHLQYSCSSSAASINMSLGALPVLPFPSCHSTRHC